MQGIFLTFALQVFYAYYQRLGEAEKLQPMELSLRKLEDISEAVSRSFQHLRESELEHRDTNEQTAE